MAYTKKIGIDSAKNEKKTKADQSLKTTGSAFAYTGYIVIEQRRSKWI
jgi:ribosomal protein L27